MKAIVHSRVAATSLRVRGTKTDQSPARGGVESGGSGHHLGELSPTAKMASSPYTPRHSRNSSTIDSYSGSPHNRRLSKSSLQDPSSPFRNSFHQPDGLDLNGLANGGGNGGTGMGNLADELADAFSDSGDEDEYNDEEQISGGTWDNAQHGHESRQANMEDDVPNSNSPLGKDGNSTRGANLSLPLRGHQRQRSGYDGSEYGSESDLDSPGMPAGLVAKIDAVESLARRGTESNGGPSDGVFQRVTDGLRDLGSQSSVEASASRSD